jgi:hypothetical protein
MHIVARMWRLYKTGIGLTTGFIGSHTVTHNFSVLHFTTHNNWVSSLPLKTPAAGWRLNYIAREQTTKKTRPSYCCLGTDLVENAAFPLLRSRLGSDHIENVSRGVCLATVVNTCHSIPKWHFLVCHNIKPSLEYDFVPSFPYDPAL